MEDEAFFVKDVEAGETVDCTPDGKVKKECLVTGTGHRRPRPGARVKLHYVGHLSTGSKFDSSRDRGEPIEVVIGKGQVIKGWERAIPTMRKGETSKITIHSDYAYGDDGQAPTIPPKATLIFEVELLEWSTFEDVSEGMTPKVYKECVKEGDGMDTPRYEGTCKVDIRVVRGSEEDEDYEGEVLFEKTGFELVMGDEAVPRTVETGLGSMKLGEKAVLKTQIPKDWEGYGQPGEPIRVAITLHSFNNRPALWAAKGSSERIRQALLRKDEGNALYKEKKLRRAVKKYETGLSFLKDPSEVKSASQKAEVERAKVPLLTNLAAVQLALKEYAAVVEVCSDALKIDPKNTKALFRRAKARRLRDEYELARKDFDLLLELEPQHPDAKGELELLAKQEKAHKAKAKEVFTNMFDKLAEKEEKAVARQVKAEPLSYPESVPRVLYVNTGKDLKEAAGEYELVVDEPKVREAPVWKMKDAKEYPWRIFVDPHGRWKVGMAHEAQSGLGYIKSEHPRENKEALPHDSATWMRVGNEEDDEPDWVLDDKVSITIAPVAD
eukprot:Sspe_Gene.29890::Locus_14435_Transcript_1_1_Confidence_1.000_Length_1794::g.29890::m.29890/K09571/FKBP4_5; FK506-binding protein 4/5